MRCSSRSTAWRGSVPFALALLAGAAVEASALDATAVERAIVSAVRKHVGEAAEIAVREVELAGAAAVEGSVFATLPAEARAGVPLRVILKVLRPDGRAARYGDARCVVDLRLPGLRTLRPVARGAVLAEADVEPAVVDAAGWPLRPLPTTAVGARLTTDVPAGQVLQRPMLVPAPVVRSGEPVTITVRAGGLQVQTKGVAAQAGRVGDLIRVINPDSGRRLSARVVGPGVVEVHHGS